MSNYKSNYKHLYWIIFASTMGGLLFGLNMAGISGAVNPIQSFFNLNDTTLGIVVSSLTIGCLFGAFIAGYFIENYGRKKIMLLSSILFAISSLGCGLAQDYFLLIIFRIIAGIGVGIISVLGPTYISEIAVPEKRGVLVSCHQLSIVIGILLAYIFDYFFIGIADGWRYMLSIPFIFSILFMILILTSIPESPRWLVAKGKQIKASRILKETRSEKLAIDEIKDIEYSTKYHSNSISNNSENISFKYLFKGKVGKIVLIGTILAIFQQIVGINAVINYAPIIFEKTGVGGDTALLQSILIGIVNFLATLIAFRFIDSKGRKPLLIWGSLGMTLTLAYVSYEFAFNPSSIGILIAILAYIAFFAASFAPVLGVINSEMFSNHFRGLAMSFTSAISWISTFIIVQFSPYILNQFGGSILFGIFAFCSFLALIFVKIWIPETKGKTLEEIEKELTS